MKGSELKKGMVVEVAGQICIVREVEVKAPSARGASTLYKVKFNDVQKGQKVEATFKGDDTLAEVMLVKRATQFSYVEDQTYYFMDSENFEQYALDRATIEEQIPYITDGLTGIVAYLVDDRLIGIELPPTVEMEIVETAPVIKGATATARSKTAVLTTGLELQVPEYLAPGERIKINTLTGKYMSRA